MDDSSRVIIKSELTLYKGWSTLKQFTIGYITQDQNQEIQVREIYDSGDGVAILLINKKTEKILLIRQFRLPVLLNGHPDGFIIECCAGLLDNAKPEERALQEIEEETGYRLDTIHKIYEGFATPGAHMEKIHYYYGYYDEMLKTGLGGGLKIEQEDIEIIQVPFSEINSLIKTGKIIDNKTIILLQWALLNKNQILT